MKRTLSLLALITCSLLLPDPAQAQFRPNPPDQRLRPPAPPRVHLRGPYIQQRQSVGPNQANRNYQPNPRSAPQGNQATPPNFKHYFLPNVKITVANGSMIVESNGLPTHPTGQFPNRSNPNTIRRQNYRWVIPTNPQISPQATEIPMGPIGVAINGIPFYNYKNAQGYDAVRGPNAEVFDSCCGHPDNRGAYHYHQLPVCVKSPFREKAGQHSTIVGYAFDGFLIYGLQDAGGRAPSNLDECNGHFGPTPEFAQGVYHYHCSTTFPYTLSKYRGVTNTGQRGRGSPGSRQGGFPPPSPRR